MRDTQARGGTVLLVEDELSVRSLAHRILTQDGYTVLEAPDGRAALSIAAAHEGPIDLLLTDAIMPRMGGAELARRMKHDAPGLRILFMTGYSDDSDVRRELAATGQPLLQKPFGVRSLSSAVRNCLD